MSGRRCFQILSVCISILLLWQSLLLSIFATEQADWRRVDGTPLISFLDGEGNPVAKELEYLNAANPNLGFDESKVTYGSIKDMDYDSVSLYFECVDYNFYIKQNAEEILENLQGTARLDFGDRSINESFIGFSMDERTGCLKAEIEFSQISPFKNENDQVRLFIQYLADEDSKTLTHKGELQYTFTQRNKTPVAEDNEPLKVELLLPQEQEEKETSIRSKTPYIIAEKCVLNEGARSISAGSDFTLSFDLKNTHKRLDIENVLLQVEVPDELRLEHSGNSFYLGNIKNNGTVTHTLNLSALPAAEAKDYKIKLKLNYEYVDEDTRRYETEDIEITLPVYQPLELVIDPIQVLPEYTVNKECNLYSPYANNSHSIMYHVTAPMEGDVFAQEKVVHLGNLSAGEGASTKFVLIPQEIGVFPITVTYTYENEWGQQYSESTTFELVCVDAPEEKETTNTVPTIVTLPQSEPSAEKNPYLVLLGMIGATLAVLLLLLFRQLGKRLRKQFVDLGR